MAPPTGHPIIGDERELRQRALERLAARIARIGGWSLDLPSMRVTWSPELFDLLGWPHDEPPDLAGCLAFYDDADLVEGAIAACAGGVPFDLEVCLHTPDGQEMWARVAGEPEHDADGRVVRIAGAFQDVTASRESARESAALAERLAATLEAITDACYVLDADWRFTFLNRSAEQLVQRRRDDLLGRVVWDEFPEALGTAVDEAYRRAVRQQEVVRIPVYPYPPLDTAFEITAYPWKDGLAVIFHDISATLRHQEHLRRAADDQRRAADDERRAAAHLRELDRTKNTFLTAVSHELRSPLTVVRGLTQTLQRLRDELDDERRARLEDAIASNADRLDALLRDLLDLDRLTRDDLGVARVRSDVVPVVRAAAHAADATGRVMVSAPPQLVAEVDPVQLERIVDNLVRNAGKYAPDADITVRLQPLGDLGVTIEVVDEGPGIPSDELERVFAPFHRLEGDVPRPGDGIGLSLVATFAEMHGGGARALPRDLGAHIQVTLPGPEAGPD